MRNPKVWLAIILAATGVALYIVYLLPLPEGFEGLKKIHYIYTSYSLFSLGAALLFWLALKGFNPLFKKAYGLVALGLAIIGITQLQIPIFQSLQAFDNPWVNFGGLMAPFALALILVLVGLRRFAMLLDVRPAAASWKLVLPLLVVGVAIAIVVPHQSEVESEVIYRWLLSLFFIQGILSILAATVAFRVRGVIGKAYRAGSTWLGVGLALYAISTVQNIVFELTTYEIPYVMEGYFPLFQLLISIAFLLSGYTFMRMTVPHAKKVASFTPSDIIVYVAGLASSPRAIDTYLDPMRHITARSTDSSLTEEDQKRLQEVYLQLEDYLATKEPVRRYTQEELRNRITAQFDLEHNSSTFWSTLPSKK